VAFGVEAFDGAHAVEFPLFVDLADLGNNGLVRKDAVRLRVAAGDGFATLGFGAGRKHL